MINLEYMVIAEDQELVTDLGEGIEGDLTEHPLTETLRGGMLPSEVEAADALLSLSCIQMPAEMEE